MCTWREHCWSPTWSLLDTPAPRSSPHSKSPWPQCPLWDALSLLLSLVIAIHLPFFFLKHKVASKSWNDPWICLVFQASASCLEARVRRRPPSTWVPSTRCLSAAPGSWPSPMAVHSRPLLLLPGREKQQTQQLHKKLSAKGQRWVQRAPVRVKFDFSVFCNGFRLKWAGFLLCVWFLPSLLMINARSSLELMWLR